MFNLYIDYMTFFDDIQNEIESFFDHLNWTYIMIYSMILYGIKYKEEFLWYRRLIKRFKLKEFSAWIAGIVSGSFFVIFSYLENGEMTSMYISQLLRSWILVIIFNSAFSKKIDEIEHDI